MAAIGDGCDRLAAILPQIGRQPVVCDYIQHNELMGIDATAKFYTELPCMPAMFNRVERAIEPRTHSGP